MKIFTSYFGNVRALKKYGIIPISIARYSPRNWDGNRLSWLAPTSFMLSDECTREKYIEMYQSICKKVNIELLIRQLSAIGDGKDVALLCYERPGQFCHRHMLAEYLTEHGIPVKEFKEWEYIQEKEQEQKTVTEESQKPTQLSLFDVL